MIGFRSRRTASPEPEEPRGFDAFEMRLGDMMRGERATLGKSLLDVERELRIRASYVAAIENCDPDAFDTPGFIPGYVRSYARYLGMDPDRAFQTFCRESGFSTAHGMSAEASSVRRADAPMQARRGPRADDPLAIPKTPFLPASDSFLSRIEPGAIGSACVLLVLIGGIGYGGWTVLNEVQRVQFAPVENTPDVLSDLDPLDAAARSASDDPDLAMAAPRDDRLDRLYRPEALDVPVMVARDAPISTLNPSEVGTFRPDLPQTDRQSIDYAIAAAGVGRPTPDEVTPPPSPQVLADQPEGVRMVAVRPAWVRVRAADGTVIFEGIMNAGDTYDVPMTQEAPTLRVGESGAIYFAMNGQHYGPAGPRGQVTSGLPLDAEMLGDAFQVADIEQDRDLMQYVAQLEAGSAAQE